MKRATHILLALLFALLQSVAPLAHAHIGGDHGVHGLHVHEIQVQVGGAAELSKCTLEAAHSPAISASQGKKQRNSAQFAFAHPMVHGYYAPLPAELTSLVVACPAAGPRPFPLLFRKQHPQAPPALG